MISGSVFLWVLILWSSLCKTMKPYSKLLRLGSNSLRYHIEGRPWWPCLLIRRMNHRRILSPAYPFGSNSFLAWLYAFLASLRWLPVRCRCLICFYSGIHIGQSWNWNCLIRWQGFYRFRWSREIERGIVGWSLRAIRMILLICTSLPNTVNPVYIIQDNEN